ncbi:MAG: DUF1501 domain-containing protein, partial [Planctomycetia bacterium]
LTAGAAGFAGLTPAALLRAAETQRGDAPPATAKRVLFLHQFGGPSHIDTFDMKPNAPDGIRGSFKPIASSVPGLPVCEHLPNWAKVMDRCALVRSVHHDNKNHNSAGYYSLTGRAPAVDDQRLRDSQELFPAYGSVYAKLRPATDGVPSFAAFPHVIADGSVTPGQHASFLGKTYDPFFIGGDPAAADFGAPELRLPDSLTADRMQSRRDLLAVVDRQSRLLEYAAAAKGINDFQRRAYSMMSSPALKAAFDLGRESDKLRDAYGRDTYGQSCLLARRLLEVGVPFVTVYFSRSIGGDGSDGWDTHQNNFEDLSKRLLPISDRTMPTLLLDLEARGLLDETLVVWMGEFGRGPKIGDRDGKGRGHWPQCYTVLMAGGGVRGGAVVGASDRIGAYPAERPVRPDDVAATMYHALGIPPETEIHDLQGRPLPIADGKPILELFG